MNVLETIRNDLDNRDFIGFFLESDGNSLTVRRLNQWQWEVTSETWRGTVNTYEKVDASKVLDWAESLIVADDRGCYVPHYNDKKWSAKKVEIFMNSLPPKMCGPFFKGFTLTAKGAETYTVRKRSNGVDWEINGKLSDFVDVLIKTREKLAEEFYWDFEAL